MIFHLFFSAASAANFEFKYREYDAMVEKFGSLVNDYPGMIEVFDALERWPHIANKDFPQCGGKKCKFLVVHITNLAKYKANNLMPEMYISGALHGNERVGPNIVAGLAEFLLAEHKANHFMIKHLVESRSLWMTPMTNAEGYASGGREEKGEDPNRDFPYNDHYGDNKSCMKTITARVIAEIYKAQMIRISVTIHGGIETISRSWGSPNHAKPGKSPGKQNMNTKQCGTCTTVAQDMSCECISVDAPDLSALKDIDTNMHLAYGETNCGGGRGYKVSGLDGCWYFPAPLASTDNVYAVNGGLEEFSYAYSWEKAINTENESPSYTNPIPAECSSTNYGGYTMKHADWKDSVKQVNYLIETTHNKGVTSGYGSSDEVYRKPSKNDGHVTRNVRALIRLLEYIKPEIMFRKSGAVGIGCNTFKAKLVKWSGKCDSPSDVEVVKEYPSTKCVGVEYWQQTAEEHEKKYPATPMVKLEKLESGTCYAISATFDEEWGKQGSSAHPKVNPQTHLVRERVEDNYKVDNAKGTGPKIDAKKERLFLVQTNSGTDSIIPGPNGSDSSNTPASSNTDSDPDSSTSESDEDFEWPFGLTKLQALGIIGAVLVLILCGVGCMVYANMSRRPDSSKPPSNSNKQRLPQRRPNTKNPNNKGKKSSASTDPYGRKYKKPQTRR